MAKLHSPQVTTAIIMLMFDLQRLGFSYVEEDEETYAWSLKIETENAFVCVRMARECDCLYVSWANKKLVEFVIHDCEVDLLDINWLVPELVKNYLQVMD